MFTQFTLFDVDFVMVNQDHQKSGRITKICEVVVLWTSPLKSKFRPLETPLAWFVLKYGCDEIKSFIFSGIRFHAKCVPHCSSKTGILYFKFLFSAPPMRLLVMRNGVRDVSKSLAVVGPDLTNVSCLSL